MIDLNIDYSLTATLNYRINNNESSCFAFGNDKSTFNDRVIINNSETSSFMSKKYDLRNELFEIKYNELIDILHFDENDELLVKFFKKTIKKEYYSNLFDYVFARLTIDQKINVLYAILESDINIFEKWYKKALIECLESSDKYLSKNANNIYNLYKEYFDRI